jgi:hypothetical protein
MGNRTALNVAFFPRMANILSRSGGPWLIPRPIPWTVAETRTGNMREKDGRQVGTGPQIDPLDRTSTVRCGGIQYMAGMARSSELRQYAASEWKADVGYLVKEFERQKEIERSMETNQKVSGSGSSDLFRDQFLDWVLGRRRYSY